MNAKSQNRKLIFWPTAAILIGALAGANPFYAPPITLRIGLAAWIADFVIAFIFWAHPITAKIGVIFAGLFLAVPCFLHAPPLFRFALMCGMFFPFIMAAIPVLFPSINGFRARLFFLCSWMGTREVKLRSRSFDIFSLLHLLAAATICASAMTVMIRVPASGFWFTLQWFSGGIMFLAFAEMLTAGHNFLTALIGVTAPALMQSPWLSVFISEFWNKRWNPGTSVIFRKILFQPLARQALVPALFAVFAFSAIVHTLLFYMALGQWSAALINGLFFAIQPIFILAEGWLGIRRWPSAAARVWTLGVLAVTSPLFVEPALQVIQSSWGVQSSGLPVTLVLIVVVIALETFYSLAALISCAGQHSRNDAAALLNA
ncbi:MAG TPA: MBOAT family protein [Candidatus Acidoferrales bacterium]|nr:MBOAT family protein [Candidatus Acidoferrales bacterium]